MKKYLTIIKTAWQRGLAYRFTVFTYRVGEILEVVALIFMWSAIYGEQEFIKGYTLREMITYILLGNLINVVVRNMLSDKVGREIKDGLLSQFLTKPIQYFTFIIFNEIGRILLAFLMSVTSQLLVIVFFLDKFIFNFDILHFLVIIAMIILAFFSELFLSYLIGLAAFWTDETHGIHLTAMRLRKFFSGGYFPLSLMPIAFVKISLLLPFAYSFFVPTQLYLGKISLATGLKGLFVQICWIFLLYGIIKIVWKIGLRRYEGVGI